MMAILFVMVVVNRTLIWDVTLDIGDIFVESRVYSWLAGWFMSLWSLFFAEANSGGSGDGGEL
jgi:hypothetical protein